MKDFGDDFDIPDFGDIANCYKDLIAENYRGVRVSIFFFNNLELSKYNTISVFSESDDNNFR